ncbi:hypothetical protein PR048_007782 [Dryococelus australis]|uniref:Uncharacterized protein n=1 Tax=Dryococelus australis TaxID=614101 RepID=A0ABQ9HW52_9NEOP|nr:hypothetical protein PR048_007782 [Dryococelus australis]
MAEDPEVWFSWLRELENEGYDSSLSDSKSEHSDITTLQYLILPASRALQKNVEIILVSWKLFLPANIVEEIVDYQQISSKYEGKSFKSTASLKKTQHLNLEELWVDDGIALDCFRATMSIKRFGTLLRTLRFDDLDTQEALKKVVTTDYMLEDFHGHCTFCQYIANKPAKYSIKIYALEA